MFCLKKMFWFHATSEMEPEPPLGGGPKSQSHQKNKRGAHIVTVTSNKSKNDAPSFTFILWKKRRWGTPICVSQVLCQSQMFSTCQQLNHFVWSVASYSLPKRNIYIIYLVMVIKLIGTITQFPKMLNLYPIHKLSNSPAEFTILKFELWSFSTCHSWRSSRQ